MKINSVLLLFIFLMVVFSEAAIDGCATQITDEQCLTCNEGYYLVIEDESNPLSNGIPKLKCQRAAEDGKYNCEEAVGTTCLKCKEGYYLSNNECKKCADNCLHCNGEVCLTCKVGFSLTFDEQQCLETLTDEQKGICEAGKYYDLTTSSCQSCMNNCNYCTESYNCFQCAENFYLRRGVASGYATEDHPDSCEAKVSESQIEHCSVKKVDHCEKCEEGYTLDKGFCIKCNDNCKSCYLSDIDDPESLTCKECVNGYHLYAGKCMIENEVKQTCDQIGEKGCLKCKEGYYFDENLMCQKCSDVCKTCVDNANKCLECADRHYFVEKDGQMTCEEVDENCERFDQAGCKECVSNLEKEDATHGFFITTDEHGKSVCKECQENCLMCTNSTHCLACVKDYTLQTNSEGGSSCAPMDDTCTEAKMGYCTQCAEGYFILENTEDSGAVQECIKCHESCKLCQNSESCVSCADDYYRPKSANANDTLLCKPKSDITMTCDADETGCVKCKNGYYMDLSNPYATNCSRCTGDCRTCEYSTEKKAMVCTSCKGVIYDGDQYVKDGVCRSCDELPNCFECLDNHCEICMDGYEMDGGKMGCSRTNWELIGPLIAVAIVILLIIIAVLIAILWWRRSKSVEEEKEAIKPFHVSSELELILLGADNDSFPLKTDKWELTFGLQKSKAIIDQDYEETVQMANMSKKEYYYEFHYTPSHKYDLTIEPKSATLKPGTAINVTFKIKTLCTTSIKDDIGISAMDVHDQNKETAKFTIVLESDLSLKLDHTELKPQMPPIGEGAFGMVFRGTYRGREVAIKKMKARNLTEEQEKEFNHEVSMMTQLRHNCVVELIGAVYTEGEISIVTEFAEYGSLSKIWKKHNPSFDAKVKILDDMVVALSYLHQNSIIHRDVKGENLLIYSLNPHSPVCAKLTDFGTCRNISERALQAKALTAGIGTPTYMSPECLLNTSDYGYPADVYSFGIVLYETFIERNAYESDPRFNQPWMIPQFVIEGNRLREPDDIPENYWELTQKCWSQEPEERPTFLNVLKEIEGWGLDIKYAFSVGVAKKDEIMAPPSLTDLPPPNPSLMTYNGESCFTDASGVPQPQNPSLMTCNGQSMFKKGPQKQTQEQMMNNPSLMTCNGESAFKQMTQGTNDDFNPSLMTCNGDSAFKQMTKGTHDDDVNVSLMTCNGESAFKEMTKGPQDDVNPSLMTCNGESAFKQMTQAPTDHNPSLMTCNGESAFKDMINGPHDEDDVNVSLMTCNGGSKFKDMIQRPNDESSSEYTSSSSSSDSSSSESD